MDPAKTGKISGLAAKPLLEASGLQLAILGEIWNYADPDNTGFLDQRGFFNAMRMISSVQSGSQLSPDASQHVRALAKFHTIPVSSNGTGSMSIQVTGSNGMSPRGSRVPSVTSSTGSMASNSRLVVPLLAPAQAAKFGAMFDRTASSPNGILSGAQARDIFLKARLPVQVLGKIWNLVDRQQRGELSRPEFIMAMHLIQSFLGKTMTVLPTVLPEAMWKTAEESRAQPPAVPSPRLGAKPNLNVWVPSPQPSAHSSQPSSPASVSSTNLNTWIMSLQQRQQYGALFDSLDKEKKGTLSGSEVASFLMTSNLPNDILASIWELANLNNSDGFNRQEFCIAMYLVQKKLAGYDLPETTPNELRESSAIATESMQSSVSQQAGTEKSPVTSAQALPKPAVFTQPAVSDSRVASSTSSQSKSHMDDLKDIFGLETSNTPISKPANDIATVSSPSSAQTPLSPLQASRTGTSFVPSSNFGRQLQKKQIEKEQQAKNATLEETNDTSSSSDEDEGPEDLDKPRYAPVIPERNNKPVFSSSDLASQPQFGNIQNNGASKTLSPQPDFTNQPAGFSNQSTGFTNQSIGFTDVAAGFTNQAAETDAQQDAIKTQLSKATVDIANSSNEVNSLSRQSANVSSRKDKAQKELAKVLKVREDIRNKLVHLKTLYQSESQMMEQKSKELVDAKNETSQLQQELSIAEANHHSEQAKLSNLQQGLDKALADSKVLKEQLSSLNTEYQKLQEQSKSLEVREKQERSKTAVIRRQVESQQSSNTQLKQQIQRLAESIKSLMSNQSDLTEQYNKLEDESLDLHDQHTTLSAEYVEKNLALPKAYSAAESEGADEEVQSKASESSSSVVNLEATSAKYPDIENVDELESKKVDENSSKEVESLEKVKDEGKETEEALEKKESTDDLYTKKSTEKDLAEKKSISEEQSTKGTQGEITVEGVEKEGAEQSKGEKAIKASEPEVRPAVKEDSLSGAEPFGSVAKRASQQTVSDDDSYEVLNREDAVITSATETKSMGKSLSIPEPRTADERKDDEQDGKEETEGKETKADELEDDAKETPETKKQNSESSLADATKLSASSGIQIESHEASTADISKKLGEEEPKDDGKDDEHVAKEKLEENNNDDDNDNGSFKRLKEHHISDSESSSSDDHFEDSVSTPIALSKHVKTTALNRISGVTHTEKEPVNTVNASAKKSTNPFAQATANDNMFDDLGLEEAVPETSDANGFDELDQQANKFTEPVGFSFTEASAAPTSSETNNEGGSDDWEQVFAGFGNDPKITASSNEKNSAPSDFTSAPSEFTSASSGFISAPLEFSSAPSKFSSQPSGFTPALATANPDANTLVEDVKKQEEKATHDLSSNYTQAQSLAIDELIGMGFNEKKSIDALKKKKWNLDDATNYLLDHS